MTITITHTERTVEINGVPARIWEGVTANGIKVICCITRIAAPAFEDLSQFDRELQATPPAVASADAVRVFPSRMVM